MAVISVAAATTGSSIAVSGDSAACLRSFLRRMLPWTRPTTSDLARGVVHGLHAVPPERRRSQQAEKSNQERHVENSPENPGDDKRTPTLLQHARIAAG